MNWLSRSRPLVIVAAAVLGAPAAAAAMPLLQPLALSAATEMGPPLPAALPPRSRATATVTHTAASAQISTAAIMIRL